MSRQTYETIDEKKRKKTLRLYPGKPKGIRYEKTKFFNLHLGLDIFTYMLKVEPQTFQKVVIMNKIVLPNGKLKQIEQLKSIK